MSQREPFDPLVLFDALLEGRLTPDEAEQLDALLIEDQQVRRRYVEYVQLHASLTWRDGAPVAGSGGEPDAAPVQAPVSPAPLVAPPQDGPLPPSTGGFAFPPGGGFLQSMPWVVFAVCVFGVGAALGLYLKNSPDVDPAAPAVAKHDRQNLAPAVAPADVAAAKELSLVSAELALPQTASFATLVKVSGCKWGACTLPTQTGSRLATGLLRLDSGKAQITFDNGARLYLQGPAVFYLHGPSRTHLQSGKLVAHVPERAIGFTIETQKAEIVDLGTEFGVDVGPSGDTEVQVLDGEIEIGAAPEPAEPRTRLLASDRSPDVLAGPRQRLLMGHARRLQTPPGDWREVEFAPEQYRGLMPVVPLTASSEWHRLLADNFDDNVLDPDKWRVVTAGIPKGNPQVREVEGRIVMVDRGHLVTINQFDPAALGGLRITGQWTFLTPDDMFEVVLRSDAVPGGEYGDTQNGVHFAARMERGTSHIGIFGLGYCADVEPRYGDILINPGDVFNFEIFDVPGGMSLRLWEASGSGASAHVHTVPARSAAANFIAFHNRNKLKNTNIAYLDNVSIEQADGSVRMNKEGILETGDDAEK
ncbi:MAG: FecR domain-containing protein [Planctomycetia bacterium]|nr:FecR domain-containing protein [Planctomycetia bacterium]